MKREKRDKSRNSRLKGAQVRKAQKRQRVEEMMEAELARLWQRLLKPLEAQKAVLPRQPISPMMVNLRLEKSKRKSLSRSSQLKKLLRKRAQVVQVQAEAAVVVEAAVEAAAVAAVAEAEAAQAKTAACRYQALKEVLNLAQVQGRRKSRKRVARKVLARMMMKRKIWNLLFSQMDRTSKTPNSKKSSSIRTISTSKCQRPPPESSQRNAKR